jgi:hypothetical protein
MLTDYQVVILTPEFLLRCRYLFVRGTQFLLGFAPGNRLPDLMGKLGKL